MIIIDAGHGGKDSGAVGHGVKEKELTLIISQYQKILCGIYGIPCILTRETDRDLSLRVRSQFINSYINKNCNIDEVLTISNHINDAVNPKAFGFEIYKSVFDNSNYAELVSEMIKKSNILATRGVKTRLTEKSKRDYYHMIREVSGRSYILEYGFIKNSRDIQSLSSNLWVTASIPIVAYLQEKRK